MSPGEWLILLFENAVTITLQKSYTSKPTCRSFWCEGVAGGVTNTSVCSTWRERGGCRLKTKEGSQWSRAETDLKLKWGEMWKEEGDRKWEEENRMCSGAHSLPKAAACISLIIYTIFLCFYILYFLGRVHGEYWIEKVGARLSPLYCLTTTVTVAAGCLPAARNAIVFTINTPCLPAQQGGLIT